MSTKINLVSILNSLEKTLFRLKFADKKIQHLFKRSTMKCQCSLSPPCRYLCSECRLLHESKDVI